MIEEGFYTSELENIMQNYKKIKKYGFSDEPKGG